MATFLSPGQPARRDRAPQAGLLTTVSPPRAPSGETLLVANSGLRWGDMAAPTADRVDPARRHPTLDRQVFETGDALALADPRTAANAPVRDPHPGGADLDALVSRRLGELGLGKLLFPLPKGCWARRSNYRRDTVERRHRRPASPAGPTAGARGRSTPRHVLATWRWPSPAPYRGPINLRCGRMLSPDKALQSGGAARRPQLRSECPLPPLLPPNDDFPPVFPQVFGPVWTHMDTTRGGRPTAKAQLRRGVGRNSRPGDVAQLARAPALQEGA